MTNSREHKYWEHRIIRHKATREEESDWLSIHEVYYEEDNPSRCTVEPVSAIGDCLQELHQDYEAMKGAFDKPILNFEDFVQEGYIGGSTK